MKGNFHVRFLGGRGRATARAYPAVTGWAEGGWAGGGGTGPLPNEVKRDYAGMRGTAVFPKVDALPGPQGQPAIRDGMERLTAVSAVRTCAGMSSSPSAVCTNSGIAVRHEPGEESLQVPAHVRIGILLDQERGGGVAQMKGQQTVLAAVLRKPRRHLVR